MSIRTAALAVLLLSAVLLPIEVPVRGSVLTGTFVLAAAVCAGWLLRVIASGGRRSVDGSRVAAAAAAFGAIAAIAFVVGQYPWFPVGPAPISAQVGGLAIFLLSSGLFLAVGHLVTSVRQLRRLTWLFVTAGALAVVTSFSAVFEVGVGRVAITSATSLGSAFWTWLVAMSAAQALFNRDLPVPGRVLAGGVAAFTLARGLLVAFSWVSGWLPPLLALSILLLLRFPRTTTALGLVVVAPALLYGGPLFEAWMAGESYSSMTRFEALRVMWQVVEHNPWLGFGPANYYHYTVLFPILGWWVRFNSHNNYVDLVGQVGVIGLLAFVWFVVEVSRMTMRLRRRLTGGFERAYLAAALAGLGGSLVSGMFADWIVPFTYNIGIRGFRASLLFWFFLGGVLALKRASGGLRGVPAAAIAGAWPGGVGVPGAPASLRNEYAWRER